LGVTLYRLQSMPTSKNAKRTTVFSIILKEVAPVGATSTNNLTQTTQLEFLEINIQTCIVVGSVKPKLI